MWTYSDSGGAIRAMSGGEIGQPCVQLRQRLAELRARLGAPHV